jgi:hypothetical protein
MENEFPTSATERSNEIPSPVPIHDVVQALVRQGITHDLAWWLAHLDRRVWEMEQRLKKLEKPDVDK